MGLVPRGSDALPNTVRSRAGREHFTWIVIDSGLVGGKVLFNHHRFVSGEVSREEKMALPGTDPESNINENTSVYEDETERLSPAG